LDLSITTISRALNGYSDVGEKTRERVARAARESGYRPSRYAKGLVNQRSHSIAWVRKDDEGSFVDPHFVEVFAGILRSTRELGYDLVVSASAAEKQLDSFARHIAERSADGFIVDLPRPNDERITYLLDAGVPFVVHGREARFDSYGWVDIDNRGIFRAIITLLLAAGHRRIAFINGDETYSFALDRHLGVSDALTAAGLPAETVTILNTVHPMTHAGFQLTEQVIEDRAVTAIVYSSALMAVEGFSALNRSGIAAGRDIAVATMDDRLQHLDLTPYEALFTFARSSLREAGHALVEELSRQCDRDLPGGGQEIGCEFRLHKDLDPALVPEPWRAQK
jgi:LacI family transcriptional regulator